ncbi:HAD family phosphatase [Aeromicrobium phragmitis]|uniref:HAD family phosphatase n=1 Tax=Aeromicrobium phragmitis TaxID=2478914 RepID=A0A3L8PJU6_9ACTN|nr:HAD family phosphatase [Aeromicrobium phragmitis]
MLFDFGGVLTTSVLNGFSDFSESVSGDRRLVLRLLSGDAEAKHLLVEHEEGRLDHDAFEAGFAQCLRAAGVDVETDGLIGRMQSHLRPDDEMIALLTAVRRLGFAVGLVSNSLGRDCYAGYDLDELFNAQAISGMEGVRKPSRRLYEIACERLGVRVDEAVMIDDLAQNITAAERLGMRGIVHTDAATTAAALSVLLEVDARELLPDAPQHAGDALEEAR